MKTNAVTHPASAGAMQRSRAGSAAASVGPVRRGRAGPAAAAAEHRNVHRRMNSAATQLRRDIERALRTRKAKPGTFTARVETRCKGAAQKIWQGMSRRPSITTVAIGGGALAAAIEVGAAELAFAIAVTYVAYQVLREGVPVADAIEEV